MTLHDALPKLTMLIPRLASDSDGEVVATVSAIRRVLKSNQCDLHDMAAALMAPQPQSQHFNAKRAKPQHKPQQQHHDYSSAEPAVDWDEVIAFCLDRAGQLGEREYDFVVSMEGNLAQWGRPTEKQGAWLLRIFARLGGQQ